MHSFSNSAEHSKRNYFQTCSFGLEAIPVSGEEFIKRAYLFKNRILLVKTIHLAVSSTIMRGMIDTYRNREFFITQSVHKLHS